MVRAMTDPLTSHPYPPSQAPPTTTCSVCFTFAQSGMHVNGNTYNTVTEKKKNNLHNTLILNKNSFTQKDVFTVYNILSM